MFTFVETPLFSRLVVEYLPDDDYAELQLALAANPEAGPVIRGAGGVRKLRWSRPGQGKRGGLRIIYYVRSVNGVIWLLTLYPKNVTDDIAPHVLRQIREELEDE
ncbi:MAG: hypothetical protein ACI9W2_003800 [Gammaproteobacteria bacterium]